jgi:hypothetical protein
MTCDLRNLLHLLVKFGFRLLLTDHLGPHGLAVDFFDTTHKFSILLTRFLKLDRIGRELLGRVDLWFFDLKVGHIGLPTYRHRAI